MGVIRFYTHGCEYNLDSSTVKTLQDETQRILGEIAEVYDMTLADPVLSKAAYRITVLYVQKILCITHRTAELLVNAALDDCNRKPKV